MRDKCVQRGREIMPVCAHIRHSYLPASLKSLYDDYVQDCFVRGLSKNTLELYHCTEGRSADWCEDCDISTSNIHRRHVRNYSTLKPTHTPKPTFNPNPTSTPPEFPFRLEKSMFQEWTPEG